MAAIGHGQLFYFRFLWQRLPMDNFAFSLVYNTIFFHRLWRFINLHENEPVGGTHFHMNGFAQRLVLTQGKDNFPCASVFKTSPPAKRSDLHENDTVGLTRFRMNGFALDSF